MPIHDISLTITPSLPVWPGDPPIHLPKPADMDRGDEFSITRIDMGAHTGTHLDAPAHFIRGGAGVEALDLNVLIGPALVVHVPDGGHVTAATLDALPIPPGTERLLLRTRNSELWGRGELTFDTNFVALAADGASWLVEHGIRLVGIDYLSVAPFDDSAPTHHVLLDAGVIPVEGLNLYGIEPGEYQLICLPLKIVGSDGSPVRAVLIT